MIHPLWMGLQGVGDRVSAMVLAMNISLAVSKIPLGIAYFVSASAAVTLTRDDGGVAFLWVACALLIADLLRSPRSRWLYSVVPCMIASGAATGLFGLGWQVAPWFMLLNATEAVIAAWLIRHNCRRDQMLTSLASLWQFVFAAGIIAPLVAATMAGMILWGVGRPVIDGIIDVATGHALGNITFTPLAMIVMRRQLWHRLAAAGAGKIAETVALLLLMVGVSAYVFTQQAQPLLFLPILPIIIIAFRVGAAPTVIAVVLLALIGGTATAVGMGPASLYDAPLAAELQFFQFYLAATVLTGLPVVADLEKRRRLHRDLRLSEERHRLLAEHSTDVLLQLDLEGRIRFVSPSIRQVSGHDPAALIGRNSRILIAPEHLDRVAAGHAATLAAAGKTHTYEYLALTPDGATRWFETNSRAIVDDHGTIDSVLNIARDITARKALERRLTSDAMTDVLTGLPNRRAFNATVSQRPLDATNDRRDCLAVLDLDHFKVINDSFGHAVGDRVLRDFAKLTRHVVRERDFVARTGGEEFAIFFPDTPVEQALLICDRVRREMAHTDLRVGSVTVRVTVSGGVSSIGPGGVDEALENADIALYTAKRGGRDRFAQAA